MYDQHEVWLDATDEILDGEYVGVLQTQDDRGEFLGMASRDQTRDRTELKDAPDEMFDVIREELQNGQAGDESHGDNPD